MSVGKSYAVALDRHGDVWGWGTNDSGQLGPEIDDMKTIGAKKLAGLKNIQSLAAGYDFLIALDNDGDVYAQGSNTYGTLGENGDEPEGQLRKISGLPAIKQIFAGHYNAFAIGEDGQFFGWGQQPSNFWRLCRQQKTGHDWSNAIHSQCRTTQKQSQQTLKIGAQI